MGSTTSVSIKVYKGSDAKIISCLNNYKLDKGVAKKNGVIKLNTYLSEASIDQMITELKDLTNDKKLLLSVEVYAPELAIHSFYGFSKGMTILSFYEFFGIVSRVPNLLNKENIEKMFHEYLKDLSG